MATLAVRCETKKNKEKKEKRKKRLAYYFSCVLTGSRFVGDYA
jgi:hypothetical protein